MKTNEDRLYCPKCGLVADFRELIEVRGCISCHRCTRDLGAELKDLIC